MHLGRAFISIFILSFIFLTGCSLSIEEASENTISAVEQSFKEESKELNEQSEQFSYYLPPQYIVETETNNNVVLTHKKQTFILFVNPYEKKDSEVMYQSTTENYEDTQVAQTFTDDGRLGYVIIAPTEGEQEFYEVTVGVGGMKITTVTDTDNMESSAKSMMEIVSSVEVNDKEN